MEIPHEIKTILHTLTEAHHHAYLVGGCVRDLLLGRTPKDWDVTTSATPEQIQALFPNHFYENDYGTVTVHLERNDPTLTEVEITPFRGEGDYADNRHPSTITFGVSLEEDLARRDFTVNAMALNGAGNIIDPFDGQKDLDQKLIRAVGNPDERFAEDALRLLRAIRFATQLTFSIEEATYQSIITNNELITRISQERIRDELIKIVMSEEPEQGFVWLAETGLLQYILPEVAEGMGVGQNKHHIYSVFEHNIKSLKFAAEFGYRLPIRLAALLHDCGKPRTKEKKGEDYTFYGHEVVGARMADAALTRLCFPGDLVKEVVHLIRHHMFYYDVGEVTEAGARRLLRRVGPEHFDDLIKLRIAERKGSGVPKAEPYRLRHLQFLVEKASQQPISTSQLAVDGNDLMTELTLKPGPQLGGILSALLAEVLDDPTKNTKDYLLSRAGELKDIDTQELKALGETAKDAAEKEREERIKEKFRV